MGLPAIAGGLWMMGEASAAPKLRAQVPQHGDFEWIGGTLGQHCGAVVKPIVGTVGACGPPTTRPEHPPPLTRCRHPARMPFTFLAHQAPVLPLLLLRPRWFDGVALCLGSMAPDLAYLAAGTRVGFASHTPAALLWFCLPVTLILTALVRRTAAPLLAHLPLPPALRDRLAPLAGPAPVLHITITSALLGASTHVLLDAFTHRHGLGVAAWPWLRTVALHVHQRPIPIYSLLQGPGSLLLALFSLLCLRALSRRAPATALPQPTPASRRRFARFAAVSLTLALLIPLLAYPAGGLPALIIRGATLVFLALVLAASASEPPATSSARAC